MWYVFYNSCFQMTSYCYSPKAWCCLCYCDAKSLTFHSILFITEDVYCKLGQVVNFKRRTLQ